MRSVHLVVPDTVDDPTHPSGGNTYDRRVRDELGELGWTVAQHAVAGSWPRPDPAALAGLGHVLAELADGSVGLLDGLVACCSAAVVLPEATRLRLVALVHLPLGAAVGPGTLRDEESAVLAGVDAVVTTSGWTRRWLVDHYRLDGDRVTVAVPGVDVADLSGGGAGPAELLCVAAVVPSKGQDLLVEALTRLRDLSWTCTCVGPLDRDPDFVRSLQQACEWNGIAERLRFVGACSPDEVARRYAASDLLVLPSRLETYGLVVTEALARGVPVVATSVGGVPEALGAAPDGTVPGLLVPGDDAQALAGALRDWLGDGGLRGDLRRAAAARRACLPPWSSTAVTLADLVCRLGGDVTVEHEGEPSAGHAGGVAADRAGGVAGERVTRP